MKSSIVLLLCVLGGVIAVAGGQSGAADVMLRAAIARETVDGDLAGAITQYEAILKRFPNDRAVAARALLQIGGCYEKLGRLEPDARRAYEQIVREYADVSPVLSEARTRLARIGSPPDQPARARDPFPMRVFDEELRDVAVVPSDSGRLVAYSRPLPATSRSPAARLFDARNAVYVRDLVTNRERLVHAIKDDRLQVVSLWWQSNDRELVIEVASLELNLELGSFVAPVLHVLTLATGRVSELTSVGANEPSRSWSGGRTWRAYWAEASAPPQPGVGQRTLRDVRLAPAGVVEGRTIGQSDSDPEFVWSPDGTRLAYHATDASRGLNELRVVTLATGESRTLDTAPTSVTSLRANNTGWSSWTARDEIMFRQEIPKVGNDFYLIPAGGGPARLVCEGRGMSNGDICFHWAPDGSTMIWQEASSARLFVRDLATMIDRPLTRGAGTEVPLRWSPDTSLLAFKSNRDGQWGIYVAPIDQAPISSPVLLARFDSEPRTTTTYGTGWWRSGAGLMLPLDFVDRNLHRLDIDARTGRPTGPVERLTQDAPWNDGATVSPDGKTIAYWYERGTRSSGIALMDVDGGRERTILEHPAPVANSDAGRLHWVSAHELVFYEFRPSAGEPPGFRLLDIRTRSTTPWLDATDLGTDAWDYVPATGEVLICTCTAESGVAFKARAIRDGRERVVRTFKEPVLRFAVSPDGRRIAYLLIKVGVAPNDPKFEAALFAMLVSGNLTAEFRVMNIDGGDDRLLVGLENQSPDFSANGDEPGPVSWSPDGRFLIVADARFKYQVLNVETSESWPLLTSDVADLTVPWQGARWSPDGRFIVLASANRRTAWRWWEGLTHDAVMKAMATRAQ